MVIINGGVTAPKGFTAAGTACGIKKDEKKDLAIVCSEHTATAAGVFTTNVVKGHSLQLTLEHIKDHCAKAVVVNSGNANACIGEQGLKDAKEITALTADILQCKPENILFNSTGVIGQALDMDALRLGIPKAASSLSENGSCDAAQAILTTDLITKEIAVELAINGEKVRIGGMAKGSGMIHPNMATMIGIVTTDANLPPLLLEKALKAAVKTSFNRVSVDGDTSVCDMVVMLANGAVAHTPIQSEEAAFKAFTEALSYVCLSLSKMIAQDGEGATKLIEICAQGAASEEDAYKIVCAVAKSPLVKTAIFGEDANWGRIITAVGYSGAGFDPNAVDISIGGLTVCKNGTALPFDENKAKAILEQKEVSILIQLNEGCFSDRMFTCDFSYDYVKINGSYRS